METIPENVMWLTPLGLARVAERIRILVQNLPLEIMVLNDLQGDIPRLQIHGNPEDSIFIRPMGQCKIESVRKQGDASLKFVSLEGCILHIRYEGCDYWFTLG